MGLISGSGGSTGEGNASPLQYSCLENLIDRGAWQVAVGGVAKSWTKLSTDTMTKKKKKNTSLQRFKKFKLHFETTQRGNYSGNKQHKKYFV